MKYTLLSFAFFASSLYAEMMVFPTVNLEKKLERNLNALTEIQPPLCPELKTSEDSDCQIYLGWGHTHSSHEAIANTNSQCGIGMGCGSGEAGVGDMAKKNEYWRFQRGTNGTYSNEYSQGTQHGGLNPVIFEPDANQEHLDRNSYLGFMRLTQYHWLQLYNYAAKELLNTQCSSVRIEFICANEDDDLNIVELTKRLTAYQNDLPVNLDNELDKKYQTELAIINRVAPLSNCFGDAKVVDALPTFCGEKIVIDPKTKIAPHCQKWVESIQKLPQHNDKTPVSLPRPEKYPYPETGYIN